MQNPALFKAGGPLIDLRDAMGGGIRQLTLEKLAHILFKPESEIKNLPEEEQSFHYRIRQMATMCGGWFAPSKQRLPDETPTLREHSIY
jgi:hypothetical protein